MDSADRIRRRIRDIRADTGFSESEIADYLGPEAAEVNFTDQFKRQYTARQNRLDAERANALTVPGLDEAVQAERESDALILPRQSPAPAEAPKPAWRRPQFEAPNPAQDMADRRSTAPRAGAAAATAASRAAQMARDALARRKRAPEMGGINVPPEQVEAARGEAKKAAARPEPARPGAEEMTERRARAVESKDLAEYQRAKDQYDADHAVWRTQFDAAIEAGDQVRAESLAASEPMPPDPPTAVTGDLEAGEVKASWDHDNDPSTPKVAETAAQTLERLKAKNPKAYDALRATATSAVGNDPADVGAWISSQFGDMDPAERITAMEAGGQRLADSRPKLAMPAGSPDGIGTPGVKQAPVPEAQQALDPRTGKPLVTRDPYNKSRTRNIAQPGGGLLPTVRGNLQRAPQRQDALAALGVENLDTFDASPAAMTPNWREQMLGIGAMAFGLDRSSYAEGPEGDDLFIADTQKLLSRHQDKIAAGFTTAPEITGGFTYRPGKEQQGRQKTRLLTNEANRLKQARMSGSAALDPTTGLPLGDLLSQAAAEGDSARVRDLTAQIRAADQSRRTQALADARSMEADQKNRQNPMRAPGMFRSSLAAAGNDPQAIAAVYRDWGMPAEAEAVLGMDNERRQIELAPQVAAAEAQGRRPAQERPDFEVANDGRRSVAEQMLDPDGATMTHDAGVQTMAILDGTYDPNSGEPMTDAQRTSGELSLARNLLQSGATPMHPSVQVAIRGIWRSMPKAGFFRDEEEDGMFTQSVRGLFRAAMKGQLGITDAALADRMYDQYSAAPE